MININTRIGSGYKGSPNRETTATSMYEVVPTAPAGTKGFEFYKFKFLNWKDCHVIINGGSQIFLMGGEEFCIDVYDAPIRSFIIVEIGIQFQYIAHY